MSDSVVRIASVALAALGIAGFSLPSQAVTISSSTPYAFNWSYSTPDGLLQGTGSLTVSGFNSSTLSIAVLLSNTSALSSSRLTAFGFGISPDATSVSFSDVADSGMINASMSSIPGLKKIEVCAFGGPNCSGGGNGGIYGGKSDAFTLLLKGSWGSSVNIDPIGFKYQTAGDSYEFTAPGGSVSAPGPLALFGFGLAALLVRRRLQAS